MVILFGHGITVEQSFELSPGLVLSPIVPPLELETTVAGCSSFADYAAALQGTEIASFTLVVEDYSGGQALVAKAWNALWTFRLLSLACRSPCLSLYSMSDGDKPVYSAASRTPFFHPLPQNHEATEAELIWAREHSNSFYKLIDVPEFASAIRCFGNAHYLLDTDVRIMLLWAGIEGLLSVDSELSRRLALYAALMIDGTLEEKTRFFEEVKSAYGVRSRAVHGGKAKAEQLASGAATASYILVTLLARCVEIGRVPSPGELDRLAVGSTIQ